MIKKILIIGPFSPPITGVSICNDKILDKIPKDYDFKVDYINTTVNSFSEKVGAFSVVKFIKQFVNYIYLYKIVKVEVVYLTIGQTFFGVLKYAPFIYVAKLLNKRVIIHIHGNYLKTQYELLSGFKKKIFYRILKKVDKGIVLSEKLKQNLTPFLSTQKIYVLPNYVENYLLENTKEIITSKYKDQLRIVYLSNLMTEKGIFDLLKALEILQEQKVKFSAKIAGNVDDKIKGEILSRISNIKNCSYEGVVRGEKKKNLLCEANVFVFPTFYKMEGQPISLLEAMATGNIILTTNHAGISDVFSEQNGLFIRKNSPEDIVSKLKIVSDNLVKFEPVMSNNFNYIKTNFTEKIFLQSLIKIVDA
ncbi:glycosyltransferase family 4 protein [Aureibaculum marinum]|uniref:glycosyltransferase family 4 protein n=1 Tax=Aureibaculum marinum TaxID=2487930 RepID=UPI001396701A|nr:glycosyltransferase family 4 protein [Aureibaculum marinum]